MKAEWKILAFFLAIGMTLSSCSNVYESMAKKNSDEALLEDARKAMNKKDWDLALEKFDGLTTGKKAEVSIIENWAAAYAGKCGLDFIDYFTSLGSASLSGSTIFGFFMNAWSGKVVSPSHCTLAQLKMEEISASAADRQPSQNLFMAVLGMVKIGVYLRTTLDRNGTDGLGDGTAELNPCTDDSANLEKAKLNEIVTGLGLITNNIVYLTAALGSGTITNALATVNSICNSFPGACGKTNSAAVTDSDRDAFRDLLKTSSSNPTAPLGVGNCVNPMVVPCC